MSEETYVSDAGQCDFCQQSGVTRKAKYDFKTQWGPWAKGCEAHFLNNGIKLGTGFGQRLIEGEPPERTDSDIRSDIMAAIEAGDYDAMEDALGDRDIAEFI